MRYFNLIPTIDYAGDQAENLFYKLFLDTEIPEQYISSYILKDWESLEDVSLYIYNDPIYWWVIAIMNNIHDVIFDLPIPQDSLSEMAKDLATIDSVFNQTLFIEIYDELEIENDSKRNIKVLKGEYLNKFLSDVVRSINE